MSFQTIVTQQLAAITARLNAITTNAKKIDELPAQDTLNPLSRIHVSIGGVSQRITIQQLIDILNSGNYDQLISIGEITRVDNEITIPTDAVWRIDDVYYGNVSPIEITIPYCATGLVRKDILVANTDNDIVLIQGTETAGSIVIRPNIPLNTVLVTEMDVTDSTISDPTPPITGENFVDRTTAQEIYGPKTFRETTSFRGDASGSYVSISENGVKFMRNQSDEEDNGSVNLTDNDVVGDWNQKLQAKDGVVALLEDIENKVDKVTGKGLSTEDYTTADKNKLSFITITQAVNLDDIETRVIELDAAVVLKGTWSAVSGVFPGAGVAQAGWSYLVTSDGTVDGVEFKDGDRIISVTDNATTSTYAGNWYKADYTDRVNTVAGRTGNVVITSGDLSDFNSSVNALIETFVSVIESTGSEISLNSNIGTYYNMYEANTSTEYTTTDLILGGKAIVLIYAATKPTVTGATETINDTFVANEKMYMTVWNNGYRVEYFFTTISHETIVDLAALPYGVMIAESANPSTIYLATPSILKTSTGRLLVSHDYNVSPNNASAIYKSDDGGQNWIKCQDITGMFWGKLFQYGSDIYIIGVSAYPNGSVSISKSTNYGNTWSTPVNVISYLENGFVHTSSSFIIKDGYFVSAFEIMANTGTFSGWHKSVLVFGNLADLMNPASWSLSNQISFNSATYPVTIGTNGTDAKRPSTAVTATKGWLEGNLIEKPGGGMMILLRLEQSPNSNNAAYLDVTWNSVTPTSSIILSTPNYIEMPGGNVKFSVQYDATSSLYWAVTNVNKYKWFNDFRMEAHIISSPDLINWTVKEKVLGYTPTVAWETEIAQYGVQYSDILIDGDDLLICARTSNVSANSFHNANLITVRKQLNFRTSVAETYIDGSLVIDSNSSRLEDSNGIAVIRDQSKYYNSPFMLNANNSAKPNWVTNGIQFDGASYLRVMHNKYLNLDNGLSVFVVIDNLQSNSGLRILSKAMGAPSANDINASDWSFSTDGLTVGACYVSTPWADLTVGQNYILAASYDSTTNSIQNYINGVNRGNPTAISGGTWSVDKILKTAAYTAGNTAELRIGNRAYGSAIPFTSKIKALHIIPAFKNSTDMIAYMNALNAIYAIY